MLEIAVQNKKYIKEKKSNSYKENRCVESLYEKIEKRLQPLYCEQKLSIREAIFSSQEQIKIQDSVGRICGVPTVSCPPAIPIVVAGEVINEEAVRLFEYYGIEMVSVVKE